MTGRFGFPWREDYGPRPAAQVARDTQDNHAA